MENHDVLTFTPVDHPDTRVHRTGFDLTDPYVEQAGAVRIFNSLECALVAVREGLR